LVVVARFLALLELFKVGLCDFDQPEPLGRLLIHRTEMSEDGVDLRTEGAWSADEDESDAGPATTAADGAAAVGAGADGTGGEDTGVDRSAADEASATDRE